MRFSVRNRTAVAMVFVVGGIATVANGTLADEFEPIVTSSNTYDSTVLTKFIPATAFITDVEDGDVIQLDGDICVYPSITTSHAVATVRAAVELPDGARIKQVIAYGRDSDTTQINIRLIRVDFTVSNLGVVSKTEALVTSFDTTGASGDFALASADNLNEVVGSFVTSPFSSAHRFHSISVDLTKAAVNFHTLCGVEITYQVPAVSTGPATVFYPIAPMRAFDSRNPAYAGSGLLAPNGSKVISIKDGHDSFGAVNAPNAIPAGATAIAYNITIAGATGPNFVSVTAGDATGFTTSAINFNGTGDLANAAIVPIAADRTIKIWGGDQSGSTFVIIDVTGYFAQLPNMGN